MVGGYQIIDLNDCIFDTDEYLWFPKIKPNFNKPVRLEGLKGKIDSLPLLEIINQWTVETSVDGVITLTFDDSNVTIVVTIGQDPDPDSGYYGTIEIVEK